MSKITKAIYTHLITRPKYNRVCIERDALKEDIKRVNIAMKELTDGFKDKQEVWEKELKKQEEKIIKLKKQILKLKADKK